MKKNIQKLLLIATELSSITLVVLLLFFYIPKYGYDYTIATLTMLFVVASIVLQQLQDDEPWKE